MIVFQRPVAKRRRTDRNTKLRMLTEQRMTQPKMGDWGGGRVGGVAGGGGGVRGGGWLSAEENRREMLGLIERDIL